MSTQGGVASAPYAEFVCPDGLTIEDLTLAATGTKSPEGDASVTTTAANYEPHVMIEFLSNSGHVPTMTAFYENWVDDGTTVGLEDNNGGTQYEVSVTNSAVVTKYSTPARTNANIAVKTGRIATTEAAECSNRGVCDYTLGMCKCFSGFTGAECSQQNALAMY